MRSPTLLNLVLVAGLPAAAFGQAVVPGTIVAQVGQSVGPNRTITEVATPAATNDGSVGFGCTVFNSELGTDSRGVWWGSGVVWLPENAPAPYIVSGAEDSIGVGINGQFIYSPSIDFAGDPTNSDDGVWTNHGYVTSGDEPAPGIPGKFMKATSSMCMFGDGDPAGIAFVATLSNTPGGTTTSRAFYRGVNTASPALSMVFTVGDVVFPAPDNFPLKFATPTISFVFDISDNGQHHVHVVGLDTGQTFNDNYVYLDGTVLAREFANAGGPFNDLWENFSQVSVNNVGQTLIAGDTNSSGAFDNCLAANGTAVVFEQDTVAGVFLQTPAFVRGVSVNNLGDAAFLWAFGPDIDPVTTGTQQAKTLFRGDVDSIVPTATVLLSTLDQLDVDGDGSGDFVVKDILNNGSLSYADDGTIALAVTLEGPSGTFNAIITVGTSAGGCAWESSGCTADQDGDGDVDSDDITLFFGAFENADSCGDQDADDDVDSDDINVFFGFFEQGGC